MSQAEEIDHYLFLLQDLVWKILEGAESSLVLKQQFGKLLSQGYPETLQLPRAYLALIAHLLHLDPLSIHPHQLPNGAALLSTFGGCISRQTAQPLELAQLGVLWMILGVRLQNELLQRAGLKIALWQLHLLDPRGRPHLSLWSCASTFCPSHLAVWNHVLFTLAYRLTHEQGFQKLAQAPLEALPMKLLDLVPDSFSALHMQFRPFAEEMTVGFMKFVTEEMSLMTQISGWNSGIFSLHKQEVAIVNAGPQVGPYDNLKQFGIRRTWSVKGRPFQEMEWEKTAYHGHLKGWTQLFAHPLWMEVKTEVQAGQVTLETSLQKEAENLPVSMVFFLTAPRLILGGKHHLESGTLERYEGKAVALELQGAQDKLVLHPDASSKMHVIPLAGGDHFWGAQFLIAFPFGSSSSFKLQVK